MKHLAIALIVVALITADFGADLWLGAHDQRAWAATDTWALIFAGVWFFHHRDQL